MSGPIEVNCVQGSAEWDSARLACVTASNAHRIVTPKTYKLSTQRNAYMAELLAQWALGYREESFMGNEWTELGRQNEDEARAAIAVATEYTPRPIGLVYKDESRLIACSPDALCDPDGGCEIKCPMAKTHIGWLLAGQAPSEFWPQLQFSMWVTGRSWWIFESYHQQLPPLIVRVPPDEAYHAALDEHVPHFVDEMLQARLRLQEMGIEAAA